MKNAIEHQRITKKYFLHIFEDFVQVDIYYIHVEPIKTD